MGIDQFEEVELDHIIKAPMESARGLFDLLQKFYPPKNGNEVIIAYEGDVTHQVIRAFTSLIEDQLEREKENEAVLRKLFHILVESLQNVSRHGEAYRKKSGVGKSPGRGALLLYRSEKYYHVMTANTMLTSKAASLKAFIEKINPLSEEELYDQYKNQLMTGDLSSKGGAGLGFIDVRRKTSNKIEYRFLEKDESTSYFLFNIKISR